MTGTSIDGVDAALVAIEGAGLTMRALVLRCTSRALGELADPLRALAQQQATTSGDIACAAEALARLHLEVLQELIAGERIDLVAVHGQTIFHHPPISWQLINPAPIAQRLRVPVVFDLRAADLAAGGQGAPITPLADYVLFRSPDETRAVVNLGGFVNFTVLEAGQPISAIRGGDVCVCNQLLDALARRLFGQAFDRGGQRARAGAVQPEPFDDLVPRLGTQLSADRSLGTGDELAEWIERYVGRFRGEDLARSACAAIAEAVTQAVGRVDRLLLAGGSIKNQALLDEFRARSPAVVSPTDDFGVPGEYREAAAMAVLGALCQDRVPITLPQVTRVSGASPVAGSWVYP